MTDDELLFNPLDPAFRADPHPALHRLRAIEPIHRSPFGPFVVTAHDACSALLRDERVICDGRRVRGPGATDAGSRFDDDLRPFLFLDPPDHTRLRGLVARQFTPNAIRRREEGIQAAVIARFDDAAAGGAIDVVGDLAVPVALQSVCDMVGVPDADRPRFVEWMAQLAGALDPDFVLPPEAVVQRQEAQDALAGYFRALLRDGGWQPGSMLDGLVEALGAGQLSEAEVVSTAVLVLVAGVETTAGLVGNGTAVLVDDPDVAAPAGADPALVPPLVEELLRLDPPVQMSSRRALEELVVGDVVVPLGAEVVLVFAAANRDPAVFEEPDRCRPGRNPNPHLSFGSGAHFCLGAALARTIGAAAFAAIGRWGPIELADEPSRKPNLVLRGYERLTVRPARRA